MSAGEIKTFEDVWKLIWDFLYKIIAFLSGKKIEKDGTTVALPEVPSIVNPY